MTHAYNVPIYHTWVTTLQALGITLKGYTSHTSRTLATRLDVNDIELFMTTVHANRKCKCRCTCGAKITFASLWLSNPPTAQCWSRPGTDPCTPQLDPFCKTALQVHRGLKKPTRQNAKLVQKVRACMTEARMIDEISSIRRGA